MLFFKLTFFLILSVVIPFFLGYLAHALKSWTARAESNEQPTADPALTTVEAEPLTEAA